MPPIQLFITDGNCVIKCSALNPSFANNLRTIHGESNYLAPNKSIIIENNRIETTGRAIYFKGFNTISLDSKIQIKNNEIVDFHSFGIEAKNQEYLLIHNNKIVSIPNPENGVIGILTVGKSITITKNSINTDEYNYNYGILSSG